MYQIFMDSPIGRLRIVEHEGQIKEISMADLPGARLNSDGTVIKSVETFPQAITEKTEILIRAERQLREYFAGSRKIFDLPLSPNGTAFFQSVWTALQAIPYGETRTYGDIAREIKRPTAARAVGMANHHNPIMIVIPCHRVIGANGQLTGYAGGMEIKQKLLDLENRHKEVNSMECLHFMDSSMDILNGQEGGSSEC